jgi:acyl-CoA synthetase (AMP-forming)/AMP-acid ligase II
MPPPSVQTLIELLEIRSRRDEHRTAFTFEGAPHTYAELWRGLEAFAAGLRGLGVERGDRVVLALPNSVEFFHAFYGVQRAGAIAVPIYPASGQDRMLSICPLCGAALVVAPSHSPEDELETFKANAESKSVIVSTPTEIQTFSEHAPFPQIHPQDVAYIQYTSGSTGSPKGVILSHRNLLTNVRQMIAGMEITEQEVFVSWLPVYHDMGLILKTMVPFYLGAETHLLQTNLKDVRLWLNVIGERRATFTAGPDFAYRLALRHCGDPRDFDLSSLRVALNAAEPVRSQTLDDFQAAFGLNDVMVAGYGLAEATVGVSMWPPGTENRVDEKGFVSAGRAFPEVELKILKQGEQVGPHEVGEILVSSPANTRGYFNNPYETERLFWCDGSIRTGDLGYLDDDGYLFIVGRIKNIIKVAGRTVYPKEVEEVVDPLPELRYSAAVGIDRDRIEGEQVYVFAEVRDHESLGQSDLHQTAFKIVETLHCRLGFRPGRVYLVRPQTIPLTFSGKIQHTLLKERYLDGRLASEGQLLFPDY